MRRVKKCFVFLFFVLLIIPFTIKGVFADAYTCQDLNDRVEEYNAVIADINTYKCSEKEIDEVQTSKCKELFLRKNKLLPELFELDTKLEYCDKIGVNNIISNNKDVCTNKLATTIHSIAQTVYKYFYILGTLLFLVFGSLDFFKNIIDSNPENFPKNRKNFFKRLTALVLIYLLPLIINLIFSILPDRFSLGTNKYICATGSYTVSNSNANVNVEAPTITSPTTTPTKVDAKKNKAARNKIAAAAKATKNYTKKNKYKWCAKRTDKNGKIINPACKTTDVRNVLTSKNTQKRMSCATLVSVSLYKAGIYEAGDINGHNINSAWKTADYLIKKGWTVVTNRKKLQPGDVMFFKNSSKPLMAVPGMSKKQRPGHVEIYAGSGKTYNTGSNWHLARIATSDNHSDFIFALRYPGE